jgi:hypothetical protein
MWYYKRGPQVCARWDPVHAAQAVPVVFLAQVCARWDPVQAAQAAAFLASPGKILTLPMFLAVLARGRDG